MAKKVAIVCTSCDKLAGSGDPTGCWAEEVMTPYRIFEKAGFAVTVASIKGGEVPMDEASLNPPFLTKEVEDFLTDNAAMVGVMESVPVASLAADEYDAAFLAGGHGACFDFPDNPALIKLLEDLWKAGKVVSAVCHGPTGFVNVKTPEGKPLVEGKKVTGFSDQEEYAVGKEGIVPYLLEQKLKSLGAIYESDKTKWASHAVRDGKLVTGQNPGSSAAAAHLVVEALTN